MASDPLALLRELYDRVGEATEGEPDRFNLACPCCDAALPVLHSLGCRIRNALWEADKAERQGGVLAIKMRSFAQRMLAPDASYEERCWAANCLALAVLKEIPAPRPVAVPDPTTVDDVVTTGGKRVS